LDTNFFIKARFYLVQNRLYQIHALAGKGYENVEAFDKYIGSFKLKRRCRVPDVRIMADRSSREMRPRSMRSAS
jgi:hypothetical protein